MSNTISIDKITSIAIRHEATRLNALELVIAGDNGKTGDARVTVYEIDGSYVAETNGEPVYSNGDYYGFAALMEEEGIDL
jgi:hypothetical protein